MEKEPSRRYASAKALAEDLGRFLEGDPILAQRSSLAYRLVKRIKKNRSLAAVAAGSLLIILALSGFGITLSLRARAQAQSAQRFGREAERMESLLFKAYSLPPHDIRLERKKVLERLDWIREGLGRQGRWSQGAGHLALGRGLMALGRLEEARQELEIAWKSSPDPEIAQALGLTLARLYQLEMEGLRGKQREDRKKELEADLLRPALEFLHRAQGLSFESTGYVDGVLALVEERPEDALAKAREAQAQLPWFFEAWLLEADVHRHRANIHLGRGEFQATEACLDASGEALAKARAIGRSAPTAYEAEVQRRMLYLQLRMSQGRLSRQDYEWGLEAIELAFQVDPDNWKVCGFASVIHRRWGTALLNQNQDPSEPLRAAISIAEAGLKLRPTDTPLLNNLGTALRYQAEWEDRQGADPRPSLAKAAEALRKAMARPAFMDFLLNNLGNCHAQQATWELNHGIDPTASANEAIVHFQKASALRPWVGHASSEAMVHLDQATFLLWQGKDAGAAFSSGLRAIDEALKLNDNSYLAHGNKADLLLLRAGSHSGPGALEDLALASRHLARVAALNASLAFSVQVKEAQILARKAALSGSPREILDAKVALERLGSKRIPSDLALPWSEALLGIPGAPPGGFESALRTLERARSERAWDARLSVQKGRMLLRLNRRREAEAALKEAEALNANLRPYLQRLSR
jgi:serine/threonine-protein kinase